MSWKKGKAGRTASGTRKQKRTYSAYDKAYNARPEEKAKRAASNKARREAMKDGRVKKGDGKDVHHVKPMSEGGAKDGKTRVISAHKNRAMKPKHLRKD